MLESRLCVEVVEVAVGLIAVGVGVDAALAGGVVEDGASLERRACAGV